MIGYPGFSIAGEKEPDNNDESFGILICDNIYIYGGKSRERCMESFLF